MRYLIYRLLKTFMSVIHWMFLILSLSLGLRAQDSILDDYLVIGLSENLALQQKELNLDKSIQALREANGLFYPSITLDAQYFLAKGGRTIDLPIGDLFNPVYSSLNQILQSNLFPQINNETIEFLPDNYHDTKLRVITPLINAEIYYNRKIRKELINVSEAEVNVYKRELIKEIKIAYYRYIESLQVLKAYESAIDLIDEAWRVNKKLVENQMSGQEKLYRIEAEKSNINAQLQKAKGDAVNAKAYVNFLINRPLTNDLKIDTMLLFPSAVDSIINRQSNLQSREEIQQLKSVVKSAEYNYKLKKSWLIPSVTNITDLGYQGYSYEFNHEQEYIMNTINISWPIFDGFQHRSKASQARIDNEILQYQLNEVQNQIELQALQATNNLETSMEAEDANYKSLCSSKEYYRLTEKQYAQGQKSLLDLLDARNQLTSAQVGHSVAHFESLIRLAELERAIAGYNLSSINQ